MKIHKVQFPLLKSIAASVICLFLLSCQGAKKDEQIKILESRINTQLSDSLAEEDISQQLVVPATFTPDSAQLLAGQLDSIFHYFHKRKGFNGTVLLTKYNQVIYKGAFGYSDFASKDTLSTETAFQLASVSKQFTAMAIMMLKEQGKIGYDDSVQQYIPTFPYKGITIRQLLTHRSGLGNYTYFSEQLWPDRNQFMTNEDVLKLMEKHQPGIFHKPDTRFDYSNTGYALLASIVERASGLPFATFMQKNIFEPLQMTNTFTFNDSLTAQRVKIATGHTGGKRKRTSDFMDTVLGDKGMYSTVEDLYKWDQALYTQKLVKRETLEEAFTGSNPSKRKKEDYGFGWRLRQLERGDSVVYHAGLWHGYTTYLLRNPKDHSALIVLSNLPNGSLKRVKDDIQDFLYPAAPKNIARNKKQKKNKAIIAQAHLN